MMELAAMTWNDIRSPAVSERQPSLTSYDWSRYRDSNFKKQLPNILTVKLPDEVVHLSTDQIRKSEMIELFNDSKVDLGKTLELTKVEKSQCKLIMKPKAEKIYPAYEPPCFSIINLDPKNVVTVTMGFRGNVTFYSTDEENRGKSNTVHNEEDEMDAFINSDIVICDITKSRKSILRVWNFVRKISKFFDKYQMYTEEVSDDEDEVEPEKQHTESKNIKTIILVSSLLTWADTPELNTVPDYVLQECCYLFRMSHDSYKSAYMLERALVKLAAEHKDKVRVTIIGTGIIYGPREATLSCLLEMTYENRVEFPILGNGQNYVPVIHIEDLTRLLNTVIHNFPEDYEHIFGVELERLTQYQLINILCKSYGVNAHTRFVSKNYSILYDMKEEDAWTLSANLPAESNYQKIVNFNLVNNISVSMPLIVKRYFALIRNFKAPCCIISGPPCNRVYDIVKRISTLLGAENLTPQFIVQSYLNHLGSKEIGQKLSLLVDKYINDLTSLPRGKALIRVLNRTFLHPKVQRNGYVLSKFPETFKEAVLLDKIFSTISTNDANNFPNYRLENCLKPETIIILHMSDREIMKETNYRTDTNGAGAAEILKNAQSFRKKLGDKNFFVEFYEKIDLFPILFDVGEYETNQECAEAVASLILTSMKPSKLTEEVEDEIISMPTLVSRMLCRGKQQVNEDSCNVEEEDNLVELYVELGTKWNSDIDNVIGEKNVKESNLIKDDKEIDQNAEIIEINQVPNQFAISQNVSQENRGNMEGAFFETGMIHDKIKKPMKELEGNVSRCCVKNIKPLKKAVSKQTYTTSSSVSLSPRVVKKPQKRSLTHKIKRRGIKSDISPEIRWSAGINKVIKGTVIGWCKAVLMKKSESNVESEFLGAYNSEPYITNRDEPVENDRVSASKDAETLTQSSVSPPSPGNKERFALFTDIDPKLIRAGSLYKTEDYAMYKTWNMFYNPTTQGFIFKTFDDNEDIMQNKKCLKRDRDASQDANLIRNICKRGDSDTEQQDDGRLPVMKFGEIVQIQHKCCVKNETETEEKLLPPAESGSDVTEKKPHVEPSVDMSDISNDYLVDSRESGSFQSFYNYSSYSKDPMVSSSVLEGMDEGLDLDYMSLLSQNIDYKNYCPLKRASDFSNASNKSILKFKIPLIPSLSKKSITTMGRKVTFSGAGDRCEIIRTFDEKFDVWKEAHKEELKNNECLRNYDPCTSKEPLGQCSSNLYKSLQGRVPNDWRNDNLSSLFDPFSTRARVVNYSEMQEYFTKHWPHFRVNPPDLTLLPTSVMVQIERNFICDSVRSYQRKSIDHICNEYMKRDDVCECNKTRFTDSIRKQPRDFLESPSLYNIMQYRRSKSTDEENDPPGKTRKDHPVFYTDCKKAALWDSSSVDNEELLHEKIGSTESLVMFWADENPTDK